MTTEGTCVVCGDKFDLDPTRRKDLPQRFCSSYCRRQSSKPKPGANHDWVRGSVR